MALDNPVARIPAGGWLRVPHRVELGVVVALTVAVVVVAAVWGTSSTQDGASTVGALDISEQAPAVVPVAAEASTVVEAEVEAASVGSASVASDSASATVPAQTEVVPGWPSLSGPAIPRSLERYQVQRGESLVTIASARGLSIADLVAWNRHLDEDSTLIRGEWIWIPQWSGSVSAVVDDPNLWIEEGKSGRGGG